MYISTALDQIPYEMYPYRAAKLVSFDNDLSKDWYVEFWVWHVKENKLKRRREKKGINRLHTKRERVAFGNTMAREINGMLKQGFVMGKDKQLGQVNLKRVTMMEAIDLVLNAKKEEKLRPKTLDNYNGIKINFEQFAEECGYKNLLTMQFDADIAKEFMDWIVNDKGLEARTRNNVLSMLKMVVQHLTLLDNTIWKAAPCAFIKKLPTQSSKHAAYSQEQMKMIKEAILETNDRQLLIFIQFIYYCFTRPGTEARLMKIEHLEKDRLFIPSDNSKNRKGDWVSIPKVFQTELAELKLDQYPGHYFLFTNTGKPGETPVGKNYFYRRFKKILDKTGLSDSSFNYDIYGFKHSGNINMFKSGVDLDVIQSQNRHQSIDQTNKYMRDLDLFRASDALDGVASF